MVRDSNNNVVKGREAERFVAQELLNQGWLILGLNIVGSGYELDIVARKRATIVIVEVKRRTVYSLGVAEVCGLIGPRKRASILLGGRQLYQRLGNPQLTLRYDLALCRWYMPEQRWDFQYFANFLSD